MTAQDATGVKHCKKDGCNDEADVMLHGRFPFCESHYMDVIQS